jgi:hypothetical protein
MTNRLVASKAANAQTVFIVNQVNGSRSGNDGIWGQSGGDLGIRLANTTTWIYPGNGNDFANGGQTYINGVAGNMFTASTPHVLTTVSTTVRNWTTAIGDYWASANYWRSYNGYIGEVLVYDSILSTENRQRVEGYLMTKWLGASNTNQLAGGGVSVDLASETWLDLNSQSQTLTNLLGSGTVSNGVLNVTGTISPGSTNAVGTLTTIVPTTLSGKLLVDVTRDGTSDCLAAQDALDLTAATLEIRDPQKLSTLMVYTLVTYPETAEPPALFALPENLGSSLWSLRQTSTKIQLYHQGGTLILFH